MENGFGSAKLTKYLTNDLFTDFSPFDTGKMTFLYSNYLVKIPIVIWNSKKKESTNTEVNPPRVRCLLSCLVDNILLGRCI